MFITTLQEEHYIWNNLVLSMEMWYLYLHNSPPPEGLSYTVQSLKTNHTTYEQII